MPLRFPGGIGKLRWMFTGIVAETGKVEGIRSSSKAIQLTLRMHRCGRSLRPGDSLAVNGCCLTAVNVRKQSRDVIVRFDLLKETWNVTNLQFASAGSLVNLERPLPANGRLDGHFVTGHIDGLGNIARLEEQAADHLIEIETSPELMRYIVHKGSIAVDGISLTVAAVKAKRFSVWIIPHTWKVTALHEREVGASVNLETDLLGKYVERFISSGSRR